MRRSTACCWSRCSLPGMSRPWPTRLMDIGSGGGSPAIPLKLALPHLHLTMVEAKVRKSAFLREASRQLELDGNGGRDHASRGAAGATPTARSVRSDQHAGGSDRDPDAEHYPGVSQARRPRAVVSRTARPGRASWSCRPCNGSTLIRSWRRCRVGRRCFRSGPSAPMFHVEQSDRKLDRLSSAGYPR